jgi:predicted GH43/DUF377 family glycosyl hydrolase
MVSPEKGVQYTLRVPLYSRRAILAAALVSTVRAADSPYATPYKYGKLVLSASPEKDAFDCRSVDCPFVFQNDGLFYMTYVGWDGTGYQTGLASSSDLLQWRKLGASSAATPATPSPATTWP